MAKKNYLAHFSIPFTIDNGMEPEAVADEIVRDIMRCGIGATLDDVVSSDLGKYSYFSFVRKELECGHGQMFKAVFTCRNDGNDRFCIESVDLVAGDDNEPPYTIGSVGGELMLDLPRNSNGTPNFEQMCRDWIGVWHRSFVGKTEDSVFGVYLIIKQIVSEGNWIN